MHCWVYQMSNWIPKQWQFVIPVAQDVSVLYKFFVYCNKHISRWCAKQWQEILNVSDIARPNPPGYCKDEPVPWPINWYWSGILKTVDIPSPEPFIFLLINVKIFYMVIVEKDLPVCNTVFHIVINILLNQMWVVTFQMRDRPKWLCSEYIFN